MGGSGGGSSSGKVSHPAYMENIHADWLDNSGLDTISSSITDVMDTALGSSPWSTMTAFDPDTRLASMNSSVGDLQTLVDLLSSGTDLNALISSVLDETRIDNAVSTFNSDFDARLNSEILPRFEAGMRNINAVQSSAFVVGKALIEENQDRLIAKYSADLHLKAFSEDAIRLIQLKLEYQRIASYMNSEYNRIGIVAKKEENDMNNEIDVKDALWDLEVFRYGGNLLGSVGGGAVGSGPQGPSQAQSAVGGAMMGAAAGAQMSGGNPYAAAAGAVVGFASAFL